MICIELEKLKEIEKRIDSLFKENTMTVAEVILVCENIKVAWLIAAGLDIVGEVYGIKRVDK